jgi:hypothetical protein
VWELWQQNRLTASSYTIWSDSGTGDFHNAASVYAFGVVAALLSRHKVELESLNFFAARHGWNDCDRHFGVISRLISQWYAKFATANVSLKLNVDQLMMLLASLQRTTGFKCSGIQFPGFLCDSVYSLINFYCYEPTVATEPN